MTCLVVLGCVSPLRPLSTACKVLPLESSLTVCSTVVAWVLVLGIMIVVFPVLNVPVPPARRLLVIPGEGMNSMGPVIRYNLEIAFVLSCERIRLVVVQVQLTWLTKVFR